MVKRFRFFVILSALVVLAIGPSLSAAPAAKPQYSLTTTSVQAADCKKETDQTDPNETAFQVCRGPADYLLILRQVESGRTSVDVRHPNGTQTPLNYQLVITPEMFHLSPKAHWLTQQDGKRETPIALLVEINVHGDQSNPEKVSQIYWALAKLDGEKTCVTQRLNANPNVRRLIKETLVDSLGKPCLASATAPNK